MRGAEIGDASGGARAEEVSVQLVLEDEAGFVDENDGGSITGDTLIAVAELLVSDFGAATVMAVVNGVAKVATGAAIVD